MSDNTSTQNLQAINSAVISGISGVLFSLQQENDKLKKENSELKNNLSDIHTNYKKIYDDVHNENIILKHDINDLEIKIKELKEENNQLRKENNKLKLDILTLYENIDIMNIKLTGQQTQITHLTNDNLKKQRQLEDIDNQNKFSDIFRFYRDYILEYEIDQLNLFSSGFTVTDLFESLKPNQRISKYKKHHNDAIQLINNLGFNSTDTLTFKQFNSNRNNLTHYIDDNYHHDKQYMLVKLNEFENIINNLQSNNSLYIHKSKATAFINSLIIYVNNM